MTGERLDRARRVLDVEAHALTAVRDRLDARFTRALDLLLACRGKVTIERRNDQIPAGRRKRSTRPSLSMIFCLPVNSGWQLEQISTWISGRVERVSILWPQAQTTVHF